MLLAGVKKWWSGSSAPEAVIAAASALAMVAPSAAQRSPSPAMLWPEGRIAVSEGLWGEGFLFPGGEAEILRFARPLGLSGAAALLLVGAGSGGPACAVARQLGVWVSGFEADPDLAALAGERARKTGLGKRVEVASWNPDQPVFRAAAYHHGLALEPLRGARAEPVLAAITAALKPGGQLVLLEMVADSPLNPADANAVAWARMESRRLDLPSEAAVTRMLGRLGFDVRVTEDISQRHAHLAVLGWRDAVGQMGQKRPSPVQAALLVREAELWFRRLHLLREGQLRLLRWHAIRRGSGPGASPPDARAIG